MFFLRYYVFYILWFFIINLQYKYAICHSTIEKETYEVDTDIIYEYIYVKANSNDTDLKATLLFLHGFPSSLHCWHHQIEFFSHEGYGCLAPNMMGYGKTYSPLNKSEYKTKSMVNHLIALLDYLQIDKVFVIGHDWGTRPASRLILYHPERTLGFILISIGYDQPAMFDLDQALKNTKETCGFEIFGYW
jgi:soluble epoxide hydrolase/lipid-phosphate phosphatase